MTKYKLDMSFDSTRGVVTLNVFDLDSDEREKIDSCSVGEDLDSGEMLDAWTRYQDTEPPDESSTEMLFNQIRSLIKEYSHDELASRRADLKEQREQLLEEFGVESLEVFREQMNGEDLSPEELRERQNIASTWEAINTELMLVRHAIRMHQDVSELETSPREKLHEERERDKTKLDEKYGLTEEVDE